jgi:hypothetical protein
MLIGTEMSRTLIRSSNPSLSGSRFFNTFSVCEFERACNSNEDALLVLAPVFSSTSKLIIRLSYK